jgi:hypothetical protein
MSRLRRPLALALAVGATLAAGVSAQARSAYSNTQILDRGCSTAFVAQPTVIALSCDNTSVLGGRRNRSYRLGEIHWRSYTRRNAYATGVWWVKNCKPDCANGHWTGYPDRLHAYRPRRGRFTRLYLRAKRANVSNVLRLIRVNVGGWSWA